MVVRRREEWAQGLALVTGTLRTLGAAALSLRARPWAARQDGNHVMVGYGALSQISQIQEHRVGVSR